MTSNSCSCTDCQNACQYKPGWFLPGEAEKLSDHLGVSFEEVFRTKLSVDWWEADHQFEKDVFLLSPSIVNGDPGEEFGADPKGKCVFYADGACTIHEVKPFECRELHHDEEHEVIKERHVGVARAWNTQENQEQITKLLDRTPISKEYSSLGALFGGF